MGCMSDMCKNIIGLLILLAGLSFLGFGLGSLDGKTAHLASGALLVLVGIGKLAHSMNMCPSCTGTDMKKSK